MVDIWSEVSGDKHITSMMATIHRVVEDQESVATVSLVNNMEQQDILEELLEKSKPKRPAGYDDLHYLLITPFRYPPLKYGSRFGSDFEPSLFYGSLNVSTALCETAYYQFVFMSGMDKPFSEAREVFYSSFNVSVRTNKCIFLDKEPFSKYESLITSKNNYIDTLSDVLCFILETPGAPQQNLNSSSQQQISH